MKPNVKDLSKEPFTSYLKERGQPSYRAAQVWQWLYQKRAVTFDEMSNLSVALRRQLTEDFSISRPRIARQSESRDGTVKFLFELADGETIESVLIPEAKRLTLCISTQVGCGFGCAFCATALMGLKRNLRASEIVDQVLEVSRMFCPHPSLSLEGRGQERRSLEGRGQEGRSFEGQGRGISYRAGERRITHVVLMGMGEPLANYTQTVKALEVLSNAAWGIGISPRRITLSSVGLVPQIQKLMEETRVNLAISLHAARDELRGKLMPVNRKYSLRQLIDCCRSLPIPRRKRITFEYVLLKGVNDSEEDARELCRLLSGIRCKVNVIPFNPHPGGSFERPGDSDINRFGQILQEQGFQVNMRRPRGDDIQAACGQLRGMSSETVRTEQWTTRDTPHSSPLTPH
jgi:23S rRNA (adenine2503-C2)-methyltransferase